MRRGVWAAPGRVNLIGEHTDYNGGLALPIAIDRRVIATVAESSGGSAGDDVTSPYVGGVLSVLRADGYDVPPTQVRFTSDIPIGAGLSSSAGLTCVTALAANDLYGLGLSREQLVLVAQRAENDFVGAPTGTLDQSASLLCQTGHALFLDFGTGQHRQVPLDLGDLHLLVVDTGVSHAHADGGYGQRRRECESGDPKRMRHVESENHRVREAVAVLEAGRPVELGPVMTASHASLRDDFEVSWPEADAVVDAVMADGAAGARMIGGGFGGSVLVLTGDPDAARAAAAPYAREVFEVRAAGGAERVE